jgi:hypothetical protein
MRFLQEEFNDISNLIDRYDLNDQYALVKRKGWVFVEIHGKSFGFYRKETSSLINGKLEYKNKYFICIDKNEQLFESFTQVLKQLEKWLGKMDSQHDA